jgi:cytochrome P450
MQRFDDLEELGTFDDAVSGNVRDPYTELAERRREGAVQRLDLSGMPMADQAKPIFMVYGFDEVSEVLRDNATFSSSIILAVFGDVLGKKVMLGMDEPEHRRLRALVSGAFTQRALARRQHDLVERVADALVDRFVDRGRAELTREFTFPYPTQIIASLLGLPQEDYPQFRRWSISILAFTFARERALAASAALREYLTPILAARRAEPRDDLISSLAHAEIDGEKLDDEEIFSFLRLLLPAGIETTYRSTGNLLFGLLSHPDQLDAVRWEPPLLTLTRVATRDTELGGQSIPAGSTVMPFLGAANRDAQRWSDPDRFDVFRPAKAHIGFGHGVHVCLGMHLARLEMRVALDRLFDRLPNLRLDPEGDDPHIRGQVFRSPTSLPVLFGA